MGYFQFAFPSGMCFLIGACLQTYVAVSDWNDAREAEAGRVAAAAGIVVADDDDWNSAAFHPVEAVYYVFNTLGPVFYVVNAVVEIRRVLASLRWHDTRRRESGVDSSDPGDGGLGNDDAGAGQPASVSTPLLSPTPSYTVVDNNKDSESTSLTANISFENSDDSESMAASSSSVSASSNSSDSVTETERRWELAASVIFGLGAILETYSTLLDDVYDSDDDDDDGGKKLAALTSGVLLPWFMTYGVINVASMHLYLLCGLVELYMQRKSLSLSTFQNFFSAEGSYDSYIFVGIIFFVMGTLLDCTMSFLFENDIVTNEFVLAKCDLASAILWNVCAPLYLMADLILLHEYYGDDDLNMYHSIWNLLCSWCDRSCHRFCNGESWRTRRRSQYYHPVTPAAGDGTESLTRNLLSENFSMSFVTPEQYHQSPDYDELP
jgi:hypothetical protein